MKELLVIKIGGNIVDDDLCLSAFLKNMAALNKTLLLVHGGGKIATKIGDQLGIESKYINGRRLTDDATIDLVTMVYGGLINKKIVAQLQSFGCNAIGLSGADANVLLAEKRKTKTNNEGQTIDYGWVGDILENGVNTKAISAFLDAGLTPIIAPLSHNGLGNILNTNADTIAQELAKALSKFYHVSLIYSFEKAGVLLDANDENTVIQKLNPAYYEQLKAESKIFAGMIPKLDNAFAALQSGVQQVIIGKAENLLALVENKTGTKISL